MFSKFNLRKDEKMKTVQKMTVSALLLAVGLLLPFLTAQIQQIGQMLSPMHLPVLLCGLLCGWKYGLAVGIVLPILRSFLFGMPMLFPQAVAMAFELGTYGFISGFVYEKVSRQNIGTVYEALIFAMLGGRIVYGIVMACIMAALHQPYSFQMFLSMAFINGIPGIILQLLLIPLIMAVLNSTKLVPFKKCPA